MIRQNDHAIAHDHEADQLGKIIMHHRRVQCRRSPAVAAAISRDAIERWGEAVPASLEAVNADDLAAQHGEVWRADAAAAISVIDWQAFGNRGAFVCLDFEEIGMGGAAAHGFAVGNHLATIARQHIKPRLAAEAVAVNCKAIAGYAVDFLKRSGADHITPAARSQAVGQFVCGVALHERGHVLESQVANRPCQPRYNMRAVKTDLHAAATADLTDWWRQHNAGWLRAFLHLLERAKDIPNQFAREAVIENDLEILELGTPGEFRETLADDLASTGDRLLADVLRQPAPHEFLDLFHQRSDQRRAKHDRTT